MVISEKAHAECLRLLELLTNKRVQESWSWVFMAPVAGIPGYHDVIKKPMDLGTVRKNLGSKPSRCRFKSHERFAKDVRLVFQNALVYNKEDEQVKGSVFDAAQHLLRVFENAYAKAKETVFNDEVDADAADHNSSTNEEQDESVSGDRHHRHHSPHRANSEQDATKSKKDKSSKKEKKSKKSKKKSKDRDKERSSSKTKDKDKDREKKSSSATDETSHRTSQSAEGSSMKSSHKSTSSSTASTSREIDHSAAVVSGTVPVVAPPPTTVVSATAVSTDAVTADNRSKVPIPPVVAVSARPPSATPAAASDAKMSEETMNACLGVLMKLIKFKEGNVSPAAPFLQPVDLMHFPDYKVKVPNRMHLYGVQKKLRSGGYATMDTYAFDVRLVFSNCLVYNSDVVLSKVIRSHAVTLIKLFETQFAKIGGAWGGISERWKCHQIIHDILADRTDGLETAQWFKYPIETYYDSADQVPYGYFKKIKHPMDLGTVSTKLHLAVYRHVPDLLQDLKLIFDNCVRYWSGDPHGVTYCDSAKKLLNVLKVQSGAVFGNHVIDKVMAKDKGSKSSSSVSAAPSSSVAPKERKPSSSSSSAAAVAVAAAPPVEEERSRKRSSKHISSNFSQREACQDILKALRQHKMKGYQGMEILTAGPFLHAVDVTKYPDYVQIVSEPMDFAKIERKLKGDRYSDVNEFSADVHLIFSNCHKYNSDPVEGADIRAMASNLRDYFVELYNDKFGTGEKSSRASSIQPLATLPSAKHDPIEAVASKLSSPTPVKKTPRPLPPRTTTTTPPAAQTQVKSVSAEPAAAPSSSKTPANSGASSATSYKSASSTTTTTTTTIKPSTAQMTAEELEAYKKRKKEKKEKKGKKDKKKKDKKDKKKKDKKDRDKDKDKVKSSHSRTDNSSLSSSAQPSVAPSNSAASEPKPAASTNLATSASTATAPPRPPQVGSKTSPAESSSGVKSKAKKSKKSELSGWEASGERVLNRLVKIEQVSKLHFDQPLLEVFPQLEQDYRRLVHEPMDLRTLRAKLNDHSLVPAEFIRLGRLIFQNAIKFNCAPDPASTHVRDMSAHLLWYFDSLCAELKLSESSNAASKLDELRKTRADIVNITPMEVKAKECQKLLRILNSQKYDKNCWPFRKPAKVLFPTLPPQYFDIVKTPMDLATIGEKLNAFEYKFHGDFIRDVRLTFENALRYNHADKDRDGWNVYSAAVHMLTVVEEQWCDATLEVVERVRRREIVRKERERLGEKRNGDKRSGGDRKVVLVTHSRPSGGPPATETGTSKTKSSSSDSLHSSSIAKASITIVPPSSRDDPESSTKLRLQIVNRSNIDRMNKSERKAEEKRRKRVRREQEIERTEKRRRTAVAATDDALREAEVRSRRRTQKLEIAEAVKLREERERQQREEEAAKALAMKMRFNAASWTGMLAMEQGFWLRKPTKLLVPTPFQAAVDSQ